MDEEIKDELDPHDETLHDLDGEEGLLEKKKKDLIDPDVDSLEDLADEEEEEVDEESFDDVDAM